MKLIYVAAICASIAGCATSKISAMPTSTQAIYDIKVIAFAPGGGLISDAVGVELANRGFTIIDTATTSSMMTRMNMSEIEASRPENLTKFKDKGVDALLVIKGGAGHDQQLQSASVRMNSTTNGQVITGLTWQNGYGGRSGSPADRIMRKGITEAAAEIADSLAERIRSV